MSDSLKGLKKAMDQTVFHDLMFSEKQKKNILQSATDNHEESIEIIILKALDESSKVGYGIYEYFQQDTVRERLREQEGKLYIILHRLEQKRFIRSTWLENQKVYHLEKKGKKLIRAWDKAKSKSVKSALKLELQGGLT